MGITYGDYLIDSGHYDPQEEEEMKDPAIFDVPTPDERDQMLEMDWKDSIKAGICPLCGSDCSAANPPVTFCPMEQKAP